MRERKKERGRVRQTDSKASRAGSAAGAASRVKRAAAEQRVK